jgi:hypothetical protein
LISSPVSGQVITLVGSIADHVLTGTYSIEGGCAQGDNGSISGLKINTLNSTWTAALQTSQGASCKGQFTLAQENTGPTGSFGLSGAASFNNCSYLSGTIRAGKFPSASHILGTSVNVDIDTGDCVVSLLGKWAVEESGVLTVAGTYAGCNDSGSATLTSSIWDY